MTVQGGLLQGLHFINTMSNADLKAKATEAEGIVVGMGQKIGRLAPFAPLAAGALILGKLGDDAYDFSNEYSKAMREVQTISKAVQDDFKGIGNEIVNLAANGPDDAIELAKAYYQIVSAGYDGAKGLNLLDVSSRAATAGITDTKTAADGLTTVLNAWGKDASEAEKVADILFKTVEKGKTTFPELAQNIATVAPMAAAMNISLEEVTGAIATLTKQGNTTPTALTQIRQAIIALNENLGDGWSKTMTFQEGLQQLRDMAGGSDTKLKEMTGRVEGMNAVLSLTGEKAKEAASDLETMKTATGAMQTAYETMMLEADNKWSMVHNKWMRELKGIGDSAKIASSGIADLFNALLTNEGDLGSQMPVINGFLDRVAALRMTGKSKTEAWIASGFTTDDQVYTQLKQMFNKIQQGFGDKENQLSRLLGIEDAQERAKELAAFLERIKNESTEELSVRTVGDEPVYKARARNWESLITLIEDAIKKSNEFDAGGGGGGKKPKPWTVSESLANIEKLKTKLGTGTVEQEIKIRFDIENEQAKIDEFAENFRNAFTKAINESWTAPFNRTTGADGKNSEITSRKGSATEAISGSQTLKTYQEQTKELTKRLAPMKQLTAEEIKQLEVERDKLNAIWMQVEAQEKFKDGLRDTSTLLGAISYAVGEIDSDLGNAVGRMADIAMNASNLMGNLATGNTIGAIASGIGVLGNMLGLLNNDSEEKTVSALDRINQSLETQSMLLASLSGENWFTLASKQADDYRKSIDEATQSLQELNISTAEENKNMRDAWEQHKEAYPFFTGSGPISFSDFKDLKGFTSETTGWDIDQFIEAWGNGEIVLSESAKEYINAAVESQKGLDSLYADLTMLTGDSLADSIIEGFKEGKSSMEDFVDDFESMMQNAVLNAMSMQVLTPLLQNWNEKLYEYMNDQDGLTESEIEILKAKYSDIIDIGSNQVDALQKITGLNLGGDSEGGYSQLQGITRNMTEETGSLLVGQFSSMREYQVRANDTMLDQLSIAEESLGVLQDIRTNTGHNVKLIDIDNKLGAMNATLKQGLGV